MDGQPQKSPEVVSVVSSFTPQTLIIGSLSVALLLFAALVILSRRKNKLSGNSLLLLGPPDAGKTSILTSLAYSHTLPTHTSLQVNTSNLSLPSLKMSVRLVDVPGHPRLRDQFRDYIDDAKAIAFVVDSSTISRNAPAVAEHLHYILHALTSLPPSRKIPTLLILAHKSDLLKTTLSSSAAGSNTLAINRVKTILERELEKRRVSHAEGVTVEGLGEEGEGTEMGGLECGNGANNVFKFDDWEGGEVEFFGTSVIPQKSSPDDEKHDAQDLSSLTTWIEEHM